MSFILSFEILGHEADVRCVRSLPTGAVLTASRDGTARQWRRADSADAPAQLVNTYAGHTNFVSAVAVDLERDLVITGGHDRRILVRPTSAAVDEQPRVLEGHEGAVCALLVVAGGKLLLSASWDLSVRVWRAEGADSFAPLATLKLHEAAVWDLLELPDGSVLTASADKVIHRVEIDAATGAHRAVRAYRGHEDCVRALATIPGAGSERFASAANDQMLIVWDAASGDALTRLVGHTAYVYSLASFVGADGGARLVSGGEDSTVRVWRVDTAAVEQTITVLGSVWSVCALPNGDIACGSSDGVARVFTEQPARAAGDLVVASFMAQVDAAAKAAAAKASTSGIDVNTLPGEEALGRDGDSDGQHMLIRNGDAADVYQWDASERRWTKIGTAVGSGDAGGGGVRRNAEVNGKRYDFVFDVDYNGQSLALGYNSGENPYEAAQRFITENEMQQDFLQQIAQFIETNTKGLVAMPEPRNMDPLTGSTGTSSSSRAPMQVDARFPHTQPVLFDKGKVDVMVAKMLELHGSKALDEAQQQRLAEVAQRAARPAGAAAAFDDADHRLVLDMLAWPDDVVFPVIDLARLLLLHHAYAARFAAGDAHAKSALLRLATFCSGEHVARKLLAFRFFANCFAHRCTREMLASEAGLVPRLLDAIGTCSENPKQPLRFAAAGLLLNVTAWLCGGLDSACTLGTEARQQVGGQCAAVVVELSADEGDDVVLQMLLTCVGTLAAARGGEQATAVRLLRDLEIDSAIDQIAGSNERGQLGTGKENNIGDGSRYVGEKYEYIAVTTASAARVKVPGGVAQVAAGGEHTCILRADSGRIACFGRNDYGQLCYGDVKERGRTPKTVVQALAPNVVVGVGERAASLDCGRHHCCAVMEHDSSLRCYGSGAFGQLGYGSRENVGNESLSSVPPVPLGDGVRVARVSAGGAHTCVLTVDGLVKCFGMAYPGLLGIAGEVGAELLPSTVGFLALGEPAVAVSSGTEHSCAVLRSGRAICWGAGLSGALGNGVQLAFVGADDAAISTGSLPPGVDKHHVPRASPLLSALAVQLGDGVVAVDVAAGSARTCVTVKVRGAAGLAVRCFGLDTYGLGYPALHTDEVDAPPLALGASADTVPAALGNVPLPPNADHLALVEVSCAFSHTCLLLAPHDDADVGGDEVRCFGYGFEGQLGSDSSENVHGVPSEPVRLPVGVRLRGGGESCCAGGRFGDDCTCTVPSPLPGQARCVAGEWRIDVDVEQDEEVDVGDGGVLVFGGGVFNGTLRRKVKGSVSSGECFKLGNGSRVIVDVGDEEEVAEVELVSGCTEGVWNTTKAGSPSSPSSCYATTDVSGGALKVVSLCASRLRDLLTYVSSGTALIISGEVVATVAVVRFRVGKLMAYEKIAN